MIRFAKELYDRFNLLCAKVDELTCRLPSMLDTIARHNDYARQLVYRPYPIVLSASGTFTHIPPGFRKGEFPADESSEPGTLGRFLWMTPGDVRHEICLTPQVTFENIEVIVEGGAVIHDIKIGNVSQIVGYNEGSAVLRVKCSTPCQVGSQIKVVLSLPKP